MEPDWNLIFQYLLGPIVVGIVVLAGQYFVVPKIEREKDLPERKPKLSIRNAKHVWSRAIACMKCFDLRPHRIVPSKRELSR
jgi:hypothetical protein